MLTLLLKVVIPNTFNWLHNVVLLFTYKLLLINTLSWTYRLLRTYKLLHIVILLVIVGFFITTLLLNETEPKTDRSLQNVELLPTINVLFIYVSFNVVVPLIFTLLQKDALQSVNNDPWICTLLQKIPVLYTLSVLHNVVLLLTIKFPWFTKSYHKFVCPKTFKLLHNVVLLYTDNVLLIVTGP